MIIYIFSFSKNWDIFRGDIEIRIFSQKEELMLLCIEKNGEKYN